MALALYNTLTLKQEPVVPLEENHVRMYTCGPTVHDFAHIGNFRTFVQQDLLRRYIRFLGFQLSHVMNITDVDDNIINKARDAGVEIGEYTARYSEAFLEDMDKLRIQRPEIMPRATAHIEAMVELILKLRESRLHLRERGIDLLQNRAVPRLRPALSPPGGSEGQTTERIDSDRVRQGKSAGFRSLEGAKAWRSVSGIHRLAQDVPAGTSSAPP